MKKPTLHTLFKYIPIIGVFLFLYIVWDIGLEKIGQAFFSIRPQFYLLAFTLFIPRMLVYVYKWIYINKKQNIYADPWYLVRIFLVSTFYGNVTPGGIGWHIRVFYVKKKSGASFEKCITNSLLDIVSGFISVLMLALIGSILLFDRFSGLTLIFLALLLVYSSAFVIFMKKERGSKIFEFLIQPLIPKKYREVIGHSVSSMYEDLPRLRDMVVPIVLETVIWAIAGIQTYIIARGFSVEIPIISIIFVNIMASTIVIVLPVTIGGLGLREGAFVVLLGLYGVSPSVAFAISFIGFLVKIFIPGLIGVVLSFNMHLKPTKQI